jgi:hypothetical protein
MLRTYPALDKIDQETPLISLLPPLRSGRALSIKASF